MSSYIDRMADAKAEIDRLRAELEEAKQYVLWHREAIAEGLGYLKENAELSQKTAALLDHYLACYDGNEDQLAIETRAILAKIASHQPASDQEPQKSA